jgi:hypothetical protein
MMKKTVDYSFAITAVEFGFGYNIDCWNMHNADRSSGTRKKTNNQRKFNIDQLIIESC